MTERDATADMLKISAYGILAQFWATIGLKEEMWQDDAKNLLLLQKALIDEAQATLQPFLDDSSMKRFNDYVERFRARIVFSEDKKAKRFHKK